jgi:hypothetical protein
MLGLAIYAYKRTIPEISSFFKRILILLRWLGLSILIFMLFEPALELSTVEKLPAKTLVFLDNSKSLGSERDGHNLKSEYLKSIKDADLDEDSYEFFQFTNETIGLSPDSLNSLDLDGDLTNFERVFDRIQRKRTNENIGSLVIFSDGNFNDGKNPIYSASELGLPIYTVTVGDTSEYSDVQISSILTNEIAYVNTAIPVNVIVKSSNYDVDSVSMNLFVDGKIIDTKKLNLKSDKESYLETFQYIPESEGAKSIKVEIEELPREASSKNNIKTEFIKVLDNKKRISLFAGAPSYDVSILSKILSQDANSKLDKFVQKKGGTFYKEPSEADLIETQLFVLAGFPNSTTPKALIDKIVKEIKKGKPYLFIFSQQIDVKKFNYMKGILPFEVISSGAKEFQVLPVAEKEALSNPLLRVSGSEEDLTLWNELAPLYKTETFLKLEPGAKSIMKIAANNTVLNEPLLIQSESNGIKSVVLTAYGLNNWRLGSLSDRMLKDEDAVDLTKKLIDNSVKWLSVKNEGRKFTITSNKDSYVAGEAVIINAQVYNDSYEALDDANVKVSFESENDSRELILSSIGNGRYTSRVEGLTSGNYTVSGRGEYRDKIIGSDQIKFNIGNLNIEYLALNANEKLMSDLADISGGKNYFFKNISNLKSDIISNQAKPKEIVNNDILNIWEKPWLLIIAIVLFSLEWFIRKRLGMM